MGRATKSLDETTLHFKETFYQDFLFEMIQPPLIVVTDPNELIVMKAKDSILDPGHDWSSDDYSEFPTIGHVRLKLIEAQKLMDKDISFSSIVQSDPYCVIKCGPAEQKTTMIKNNLNPVWNMNFDFDWHGEEIIRIDCWDHNKPVDKKSAFLRRANLSPHSVRLTHFAPSHWINFYREILLDG